jgi:hypothetical protein
VAVAGTGAHAQVQRHTTAHAEENEEGQIMLCHPCACFWLGVAMRAALFLVGLMSRSYGKLFTFM